MIYLGINITGHWNQNPWKPQIVLMPKLGRWKIKFNLKKKKATLSFTA